MDTKNIVFLDYATFPGSVKLKTIHGAHNLILHARTSPEQCAERIAKADVVITNKVKLTSELIAQAPDLKFIAVAATGFDAIDIDACKARNIPVANIRDYAVDTVPEHTFALLFALRRSITAYHQAVQKGRWQQAGQFCFFDYSIKNLAGSTLGIIGDGVLGKRVAEIAKSLGMKVLFAAYKGVSNMGPLYTDFDEVLKTSDILSLHCPLLPSTENMITENEFALMKPEVLLINTARGGIVNEEDLYRALMTRRIAGAAFDVAKHEPPDNDAPIMKLTQLPNFILTPHISWASQEAIQSLADKLIDNINAWLSGKPINIVNP